MYVHTIKSLYAHIHTTAKCSILVSTYYALPSAHHNTYVVPHKQCIQMLDASEAPEMPKSYIRTYVQQTRVIHVHMHMLGTFASFPNKSSCDSNQR